MTKDTFQDAASVNDGDFQNFAFAEQRKILSNLMQEALASDDNKAIYLMKKFLSLPTS